MRPRDKWPAPGNRWERGEFAEQEGQKAKSSQRSENGRPEWKGRGAEGGEVRQHTGQTQGTPKVPTDPAHAPNPTPKNIVNVLGH